MFKQRNCRRHLVSSRVLDGDDPKICSVFFLLISHREMNKIPWNKQKSCPQESEEGQFVQDSYPELEKSSCQLTMLSGSSGRTNEVVKFTIYFSNFFHLLYKQGKVIFLKIFPPWYPSHSCNHLVPYQLKINQKVKWCQALKKGMEFENLSYMYLNIDVWAAVCTYITHSKKC